MPLYFNAALLQKVATYKCLKIVYLKKPPAAGRRRLEQVHHGNGKLRHQKVKILSLPHLHWIHLHPWVDI